MGTFISKNPTLAPIGRVDGYNGNNTNASAITQQVRVDRLKAGYPAFQGGNFIKSSFAVKGNLCHPTVKSDFTQEQLCGAPVKAMHLDLLG